MEFVHAPADVLQQFDASHGHRGGPTGRSGGDRMRGGDLCGSYSADVPAVAVHPRTGAATAGPARARAGRCFDSDDGCHGGLVDHRGAVGRGAALRYGHPVTIEWGASGRVRSGCAGAAVDSTVSSRPAGAAVTGPRGSGVGAARTVELQHPAVASGAGVRGRQATSGHRATAGITHTRAGDPASPGGFRIRQTCSRCSALRQSRHRKG